MRKAALSIVEGEAFKAPVSDIVIGKDNLKDYVGSPIWTSDRMYALTPPGVIMGLAYTSMGGSALYIESVVESPLTKTN